MKILVTGGAGYVGSACLRWLLRNDHDAVAFDNLAAGNPGAVPDGRLVEGDIEDRAALARAMKDHGSEAVMHFAAVASVPESIDQPELYYRTNVFGSKNVLDAANECGIKRVLFSSTAAVYGFHAEMPLREDSPRDPVTPYGKTKLAVEWMLEDYRRAYGIGYVALRYFNACGADSDGEFGEDRQHETHVIPLIFQTALGKQPTFKVFGGDWQTPDGTCVRDYVHTEDLASAHQLALEALQPRESRVYNVGIGKGFSVREVLEACETAMGKGVPHEVAGRRPGDPETLIASCEKLKRELGWEPRYTEIREIVQTAWRWHER
jgi:UDP-glucose 4-epimerase